MLTLAAPRSCAVTSSTNAFNGVGCHHAPLLPRSNPHSAHGTTACHFPRFRSLEAFVRRPLASVFAAIRHRPASETLHTGCRDDASRATVGLPSAADAPLQRSELAKSAIFCLNRNRCQQRQHFPIAAIGSRYVGQLSDGNRGRWAAFESHNGYQLRSACTSPNSSRSPKERAAVVMTACYGGAYFASSIILIVSLSTSSATAFSLGSEERMPSKAFGLIIPILVLPAS